MSIAAVSFNPPRNVLNSKPHGINMSKRRLVSSSEIRREGTGRHGLFTASSNTEFGSRWLARLKTSRLNQFQSTTRGSRRRTSPRRGVEFVVRRSPANALQMPTAVSGMTIVLRSLQVKSQIVSRWNGSERLYYKQAKVSIIRWLLDYQARRNQHTGGLAGVLFFSPREVIPGCV